MQEFEFIRATTIEQVCQALKAPGTRIIAGGSDVLVQMRHERLHAERLVDISRLDGLRFIRQEDGMLRLGSLLTYNELLTAPVLQAEAAALVQAAATVGCTQTRNRGTLGGNLANASPAGDTLPPLLVLEAQVVLISTEGERSLPLSEFLRGPGQTALQLGEVIGEVRFRCPPPGTRTIFLKLGSRQGMAVSVVSAAAALRLRAQNLVEEARIALGAVAPTAIRCPRAEATLVGQAFSEDLARQAARLAAEECAPIDDVRGSAEYRRHAVRVLVRRALLSLSQAS
jgi:CO/xanthine dehydrogenase FAD-binding subunit